MSGSLIEKRSYKSIPYHLWNPFTNMSEFLILKNYGPSIITRGEGQYVFDAKGRRYINGLSSLWNVAVGFGRQEIIDAITEQLNVLPYASCFRQSHPKAIELAARLIEITDDHYQQVFLGTNGSEAVEAAIKMARQFHKQSPNPLDQSRYIIISLNGSYHGVSYGAISTSGLPEDLEKFGPLVPGFIQIKPPYCYRCPYDKTLYPDCGLECAEELARAIENQGASNVAAFILEPIMGVSGIITPSKEYYLRIGTICKTYGVLLIADEVTTGFGRTGGLFATQSWVHRPDILCLGKAISNGYLPLSATLATQDIFERFLEKGNQFNHGSTASGHPVCSAAGLATIEILIKEKIAQNAETMGKYLVSKLNSLKANNEIIGEIRGQGLMIGIELVKDKSSKTPLTLQEMGEVVLDLSDKGLLVYFNNGSNVIGLFPALTIDEDLVDEIVSILSVALSR